jgi:hypothetical protein
MPRDARSSAIYDPAFALVFHVGDGCWGDLAAEVGFDHSQREIGPRREPARFELGKAQPQVPQRRKVALTRLETKQYGTQIAAAMIT